MIAVPKDARKAKPAKPGVLRHCPVCGDSIYKQAKTYCSAKCHRRADYAKSVGRALPLPAPGS